MSGARPPASLGKLACYPTIPAVLQGGPFLVTASGMLRTLHALLARDFCTRPGAGRGGDFYLGKRRRNLSKKGRGDASPGERAVGRQVHASAFPCVFVLAVRRACIPGVFIQSLAPTPRANDTHLTSMFMRSSERHFGRNSCKLHHPKLP